jgi:Bacteriophytochrome (light-regulated signal transduction histidine kinase)
MNIKDIVNRDVVNLTNCEQEPIHIPGSIQPHGFLLGINAATYVIEYCSGNVDAYVGKSYEVVLGKTPVDIWGKEVQARIDKYLKGATFTTPLQLFIDDKKLQCTVHRTGDIYLVEAEPAVDDYEYPDVYDQTRQFLSYMEHSISLQELCSLVADRTRQITGYDRVMIYRFDEEYNGEVFAESCRGDLEPFLGLHYPHTDIPVQARELYMRNLLRLIGDIGYQPVPIYTTIGSDNSSLDLSLSVLRSTSPIHVQYLQNMGVGATLTISLIYKGRLWGLIACHHYSPKVIPPNIRIAAQLQGHFIASQIDMRQANEAYDTSRQSAVAVDKTLALTKTSQSFREIADSESILEICNASGVVISFNNELYTGGKTPSEADIRNIIRDLSAQYLHTGFHTAHLASALTYASKFAKIASGLTYHPLSIVNNDCIIWFRPETVTEMHWGGDPSKAIVKDEKGLHPRKSFELWKEIVKYKAKPWMQPELDAAATFAYSLQKHMALIVATAEEKRYRALTETLKKSNEELENINWISTHDLQEPLRKIQLMASRILTQGDEQLSEKTLDFIQRMNASASRMQTLLRDILNYTKLRYNEEQLIPVNVNNLVNDVVVGIEEQAKEHNVQFEISDLPTINGIPFLLTQLFTNLIGNAIKFSDAERQQVITITEEPSINIDGKDHRHISITDTGIGFEKKYAESIFKIFSRLNNHQSYHGSGVGLALCKKIMETHHGYIDADGAIGKGAAIHLYFPVQ